MIPINPRIEEAPCVVSMLAIQRVDGIVAIEEWNER